MKPITKAEMVDFLYFVCKTCRSEHCMTDDEKCPIRCRRVRRAIDKLIEKQGGKK